MFNLASYLPYLINRAGVRLAEAFGAELEAHGVTLPMWRSWRRFTTGASSGSASSPN
jgi:hypothetical protein